jgi:LysR family transcriptional regulator, transcriptional activator of nhaA
VGEPRLSSWVRREDMEWLNYQHLYYFSVIAREGGLAPAARRLRLTHSTLSAQLRALEAHFGAQLFDRRGKRLVLTRFGVDAARYADDIFRLGRELNDVAQDLTRSRRPLRVGVVPSLPETLVHHLLAPGIQDRQTASVEVVQQSLGALIESLSAGRLDLALSDELPVCVLQSRVQARVLGASGISLYASRHIASSLDGSFPEFLEQQPFILPPTSVVLRRSLDAWLVRNQVQIRLRAEVETPSLLRILGAAGRGIFPVPAVLRREIELLRDVEELGACEGIIERYYLLSIEHRLEHPALDRIIDGARRSTTFALATSRQPGGKALVPELFARPDDDDTDATTTRSVENAAGQSSGGLPYDMVE